MDPSLPIRVFLLDDHEVVRRGLRDLLESDGDIEIVGESGYRRRRPRRRIPALRPDVAVLDARLPDGSGIDVCRDVRSVDPIIKALILTSLRRRRGAVRGDPGRCGRLRPQADRRQRPRRRRPPGRGRSVPARPAAHRARVLERLRHGPEEPTELASLTEQERKILDLIAEGLTNRQIGERLFLAEKTVKNYVSSILSKLGLERRTQAAVLASKLLG